MKDIQSYKDHPQVMFIKEENKSTEELTNGYKLLILCQHDSSFILTETVSKSKWAIYLVDLKSTPGALNSKLVMSLTEAQLKPSTIKGRNWQISDYLVAAENLLNKKLGRISVHQYLADDQKKRDDEEKKKELERQMNKAKADKVIFDYKAKRKPLGSLAKIAPYHSLVSFYPAYADYRSVEKGFKLANSNKDSIFLLRGFAGTSTVVLIDQKLRPGNDEGVIFAKIDLHFSFATNQIPHQEDIIREIEKSIYDKLKKPVPAESLKNEPENKLIIEGINRYESDVFNWQTNCYSFDPASYGFMPFGYYIVFGTGKLLNYARKSYNQNHTDQQIVDESEDYLGDIFWSGEKSGLGMGRYHNSKEYFKGLFSFDNFRNRTDSIGISYYNDGYGLHTATGKITISKNGQIQIDAGVIWKGQQKILIDSNGQVSLPETNIFRTPSSMIISKEFSNGHPIHQCLILYNNGDIYCGDLNDALEKDSRNGNAFKKNGDFYSCRFLKDRAFMERGFLYSKRRRT